MLLINEKEYICLEKETVFQCILNGGTAKISVKINGMDQYTDVQEFTEDGLVSVTLPHGKIKATLTGDAKLAMSVQ